MQFVLHGAAWRHINRIRTFRVRFNNCNRTGLFHFAMASLCRYDGEYPVAKLSCPDRVKRKLKDFPDKMSDGAAAEIYS
jgi:hypothetical protein